MQQSEKEGHIVMEGKIIKKLERKREVRRERERERERKGELRPNLATVHGNNKLHQRQMSRCRVRAQTHDAGDDARCIDSCMRTISKPIARQAERMRSRISEQ